MAKKEFLDVAKKVAKNLENAAVNADGASADAINAVQQEEAQPVVEQPAVETAAPAATEPTMEEQIRAQRQEAERIAALPAEERKAVVNANRQEAMRQNLESQAAPLEQTIEAPKTIKEEEDIQDTRDQGKLAASQQAQEKTISDVIADLEEQRRQAQEEGAAREKEAKRNAAWAGATEMAAALANLIAVGHGAKSQSYKGVTQDWMQKADAEAKESRSRVQDLRNRQNETKLKMDQLRQSNILAMQNLRRQQEADKANREYRAAQTEYQNARTESERIEASLKKAESEAKIASLEAQAKQRIMQGQAAVTRANNTGKSKSNATPVDVPYVKSQNWVDMFNANNNSANGMGRYASQFGGSVAPAGKGKGKDDDDDKKDNKKIVTESYFD